LSKWLVKQGVVISTPIEHYAIISNLHCGALISRSGSIDWFCPGRFDAPACFAAIVGEPQNGRWLLAPVDEDTVQVERRYRQDTLTLETLFRTATGTVQLTDLMPIENGCRIIRRVECLQGSVPMRMICSPRFDYGKHPSDRIDCQPLNAHFLMGDDRLSMSVLPGTSGAQLTVEDSALVMHFELTEGQQCTVLLTCKCDDAQLEAFPDAEEQIRHTEQWWRQWIGRCQYDGRWKEAVKRSLITLKALTYQPSGAMIAALTTSLPEVPGGSANWDYRFCWLRDAAFALKVFLDAGYTEEARAWREWLHEATSQHEGEHHALYTIDAKIAKEERELSWLPGWRNSRPVRANNGASDQYQLDMPGELMEVLHLARDYGLARTDEDWELQCEMLGHLEDSWHETDPGIWEFRTMDEHMTHSKVLCWVAFDRSIQDAERFSLPGPVEHWKKIRAEIREDILKRGVDPQGGHFTQRYGKPEVDAALLLIPLVGFLPADDPRMLATVQEVEKQLCEEGLVRRYRTGDQANEEDVFIACSFWLADNYWLAGRKADAEELFARVLALRNDVGLLSEEYDTVNRHLLGNFPQGLSHLGLVSTACLLTTGKAEEVMLS
jgi:GH15 family glucan-1,4-alpha-glucosidase